VRLLRALRVVGAATGLAAAISTFSGCCESCPVYAGAIVRVRLLNSSLTGPKLVFFHVYRHGAAFVPEDAVASRSFFALEDPAESYALRDGEIYVFNSVNAYDIAVFVDMDDDQELSPGDIEKIVMNESFIHNEVREVDYTQFAIVN
jgi:hypothetical protein